MNLQTLRTGHGFGAGIGGFVRPRMVAAAAFGAFLVPMVAAGDASALTRYCSGAYVVDVDDDSEDQIVNEWVFEGEGHHRTADRARRLARDALVACMTAHWQVRDTAGAPEACAREANIILYSYAGQSTVLAHEVHDAVCSGRTGHVEADVMYRTWGDRNCYDEGTLATEAFDCSAAAGD